VLREHEDLVVKRLQAASLRHQADGAQRQTPFQPIEISPASVKIAGRVIWIGKAS